MKLTPLELQVITEEAEKAKEAGYCHQTFQWVAGSLTGVQLVTNANKDELKARLDPNPPIRKALERGARVLTKHPPSA